MKIYEICFSPTGGTRKAADILAGELSTEIQNIDLTDSTADFNNISLTQNDISVIAVPSYGGRVPETAAKRISAIHGNGSRAILMCVYGNRAYEDTLAELQDAIVGCIIYKAHTDSFLLDNGYGSGFDIRTYSGFSMYLPCNGSPYLDDSYRRLEWNMATGLIM